MNEISDKVISTYPYRNVKPKERRKAFCVVFVINFTPRHAQSLKVLSANHHHKSISIEWQITANGFVLSVFATHTKSPTHAAPRANVDEWGTVEFPTKPCHAHQNCYLNFLSIVRQNLSYLDEKQPRNSNGRKVCIPYRYRILHCIGSKHPKWPRTSNELLQSIIAQFVRPLILCTNAAAWNISRCSIGLDNLGHLVEAINAT